MVRCGNLGSGPRTRVRRPEAQYTEREQPQHPGVRSSAVCSEAATFETGWVFGTGACFGLRALRDESVGSLDEGRVTDTTEPDGDGLLDADPSASLIATAMDFLTHELAACVSLEQAACGLEHMQRQ